MNSVRASIVSLSLLALGASPSSAQRALLAPIQYRTIQPLQDNTLYQDPMGGLSNGAGEHIFAGLTATGAIRRALLVFDIAGNVPSGARIVGATLTLHVTRTIASQQNVSLHLLLAGWGEGTSNAFGQEGMGATATAGDATWLHTYYPGSYWATPGGDYASTASATRSVGFFGPHTWSSAQMVSDVQAWLDAPGTNFGWIVVGAEPPGGFVTAKRFGSRNGSAGLRPTLTVAFDSFPQGACCLPGGGCVQTFAANCTAAGGSYQGDGTTCFPNPCPQPTGACCFLDGSCLQLTSGDCTAQGGTWQGAFTSCVPDPCPP